MTTMSIENQTVKLKSTPESINYVESLVEEIKSDFNISDDAYGNMLVALTEAVNNAITHGNACDCQKHVSLSYELYKDRLLFSISDEGKGFDFYTLPDPTSPENIDKPNGRGIFLMKHLADQLIFSDNGRTVELLFKLR